MQFLFGESVLLSVNKESLLIHKQGCLNYFYICSFISVYIYKELYEELLWCRHTTFFFLKGPNVFQSLKCFYLNIFLISIRSNFKDFH